MESVNVTKVSGGDCRRRPFSATGKAFRFIVRTVRARKPGIIAIVVLHVSIQHEMPMFHRGLTCNQTRHIISGTSLHVLDAIRYPGPCAVRVHGTRRMFFFFFAEVKNEFEEERLHVSAIHVLRVRWCCGQF